MKSLARLHRLRGTTPGASARDTRVSEQNQRPVDFAEHREEELRI
jgi:hypothetical protein